MPDTPETPELPTYDAARERVHKGGASTLDRFVYAHEPRDREGEEEFRARLLAVISEASARGARVERERCIADAEGERLTGDTGEEGDKAYNMAIEHVVDAIRSRSLSVGSAAGE